MHADISRGQYVDPRAGQITVGEYAELWRKTQLHRDSTAERTERAIRRHIVPVIGGLQLARVRSSHIKGWVKNRSTEMAPSTLAMIYNGTLIPLFNSAAAYKRIGASPCVGVRLPEIPDAQYYIALRLDADGEVGRSSASNGTPSILRPVRSTYAIN
jgi:hypothetical protein